MANTTKTARTARTAAKAPAAKAAPAPAPAAEQAAPLPKGVRPALPEGQAYSMRAHPAGAYVTVMVGHNPKQAGSGAANRFALYGQLVAQHGNGNFTVQQVLNSGVQPSDVRYNVRNGYIALTPTKGAAPKAPSNPYTGG